ncbi:hypothetical protein GCM10022271_15680 [Corallibacter vietnamensis]|uniref:Sulfotransferase domain-containing protein n=2 Tax=Corallibacter vietnamensis TaxID=904130 RepID=A0ABP7H7E9_9FLAO
MIRLKFKKNKKISRDKVELFILGAQKCGTTSLHYYLDQHPSFQGSIPKETDFFSFDGLYEMGLNKYHTFFRNNNKNKVIRFDSSTEYLYIPYCAERIKQYNPKSKFIIIKRDPVKRAISAYKMYKSLSEGKLWSKEYKRKVIQYNNVYGDKMIDFLKRKPFPEFIDIVKEEYEILLKTKEFIYEPSFIARGNYEQQLNRFLNFFPKENILEIDFSRYSNQTISVLNEILEFMGIKDELFDNSYDFSIQLKSKEALTINTSTQSDLSIMFESIYKN